MDISKKKNLRRVEQIDPTTNRSRWSEIEKRWIDLYRNRQAKPGESAVHKVNGNDEWLCEAYMETDYSLLCDENFVKKMKEYASFLVLTSNV